MDTASGVLDDVLYLNSLSHEVVLIVTPDPSSLMASYNLIKFLNQTYKVKKFNLVCNFVQDERDALKLYQKFVELNEKFLCVGLTFGGFVPSDEKLREATKSQQLILDVYPDSSSGFAIRQISEKLSCFRHIIERGGGLQFFGEPLGGIA